jgi:perosamine synthetase
MKIPLFKIHYDEDDIKAVSDIIKRGSYWAIGPEIEEFENKLAKYIGKKYAVVFNSGTSALHALLLTYNIKEEDEIIVPSFTFISTANTPLFVNAKPVFAEIEDQTYGLDIDDVKNKITEKTKAIILVHYAGQPARDTEELRELAQRHNLILIEDAAESLGARIGEKKVGTFGDAAMFSFCQNKIITTGEGGVILTDSREIADKLKLIRSHGRAGKGNYFSSSEKPSYVALGYNFRMPTMLASLGIYHLNKLDKILEMRRNIAK